MTTQDYINSAFGELEYETGIAAIGVQLPPLFMRVQTLAELRGVDPQKFLVGLGCREMALCPNGYGVVELAVGAARRALDSWGGSVNDLGLLVVGSESALDMSRPLSAFVAERLGLQGRTRSYEVKHACYGGTLALRQALEWSWSGSSDGRSALVIAADVGLYAPKDPGEPTQGAAAVAFVVGQPTVARAAKRTFAYSSPAYDFWRPTGESYPRVDGPLSLQCYKNAAAACFRQAFAKPGLTQAAATLRSFCFHTPFPKMVRKSWQHLCSTFAMPDAQIDALFDTQVAPTMEWNCRTGNSYTASLWTAVAKELAASAPGDRLSAFSYGSGCGAELLLLESTRGPDAAPWQAHFERDLAERSELSAAQYEQLRRGRFSAVPGRAAAEPLEHSPAAMG